MPSADRRRNLNIWYMRDNHTFRKLGTDPETAKQAIREEFEDGYTYGMLCTKDAHVEYVHARGKLEPFLAEVDTFFGKVRDMSIGAGI
jgi:hypothetical protein